LVKVSYYREAAAEPNAFDFQKYFPTSQAIILLQDWQTDYPLSDEKKLKLSDSCEFIFSAIPEISVLAVYKPWNELFAYLQKE